MKLPRNVKGSDLVKALCRDWKGFEDYLQA